MSHQRYPSMDPVKEPHSVSLKVLRLSRPSLVTQHALTTPTSPSSGTQVQTIPASLAYKSTSSTNPDPFLLTPILNLPPSFGSAYVGETFRCTLCANHDAVDASAPSLFNSTAPLAGAPPFSPASPQTPMTQKRKFIRDVRIEAEMKTPGSAAVQKLHLGPDTGVGDDEKSNIDSGGDGGVDLNHGDTLQRIVNFDLKEEGNHVLAVTVSYYEATETSGRTRTFRKLYQFICKGSLIVRTKVGVLPAPSSTGSREEKASKDGGDSTQVEVKGKRRWVMEAQLENCSEDAMQLERVGLDLEKGLRYRDANWTVSGSQKPILYPGEVEQVCFVVEEDKVVGGIVEDKDGRLVFGVLGIAWRTEMGNRGFLSTGKLGMRSVR